MIYVSQVLCPKRHCIIAFAFEAPRYRTDDVELFRQASSEVTHIRLNRLIQSRTINPWCGICGAADTSWTIDFTVTAWDTLEEAAPILEESARQQHESRNLIDAQRKKAQNN